MEELFAALPTQHDWDSYGAVPTAEEWKDAAREFLAALPVMQRHDPEVVPLADGGVQLEWRVDGYEIEIEFSPESEGPLVSSPTPSQPATS